MPRLIETQTAEAIELGDLVETLATGGFDPDDEESVAAFGPALGKLGNNRRFLGDLVIEELKRGCADQARRNHYTAQVILLHAAPSFAIRANFWPAAADSVVVNSGTEPFFYDVPHDHNFSFLTVGYLGPGYWSDYFEYDYDSVTGFAGEPVRLRFVERSRLEPGKVMLYRRFRDVHSQLPPDSLSVSLNILAQSPCTDFCDQYRFDLERLEVAGLVNNSPLEALVKLAAHLGGGDGRDLVESFAARHPSDRVRFAAIEAQASLKPDAEARLALYERAARDSGFVAAMAAGKLRQLLSARIRPRL
ncbi:MAG TPA: transposase [Allosphingosinicella sp.]|nr:transposase [Allosphingosinicella sp.]